MSKFSTIQKEKITKRILELSKKKIKKEVHYTYREIADILKKEDIDITYVYVGLVINKNK
jgi:hypothetical protein